MQPGGVGGVPGQVEVLRRVTPEPRLVRAAHEFEAQMMKELLQPLTQPAAWDEGQGEESGILGDYARESLAGGLSARGGMGIADQIVGALSHSGNRSPNLPVVKNPLTSTGMSGHK
jgi:Rod binding domain-containing protein